MNIEDIDDVYMSIGITYGFDINDNFNVETGASAGYTEKDYSAGEDGGVNEYKVYLTAGYSINKAISISANISHTDSLDDDVLPDEVVDVTTFDFLIMG